MNSSVDVGKEDQGAAGAWLSSHNQLAEPGGLDTMHLFLTVQGIESLGQGACWNSGIGD